MFAATADRPRHAFPALLLGNLALAFGPLFVRFADVGPVASAFWRLTLALPLLWALAAREGAPSSRATRWERALPYAAGLFFAADLACWHVGILGTRMANATLFGNSASLFLVLWGLVILRALPTPLQGAALLLAGVGAALLLGRSLDLGPDTLRGDLFSLAAGLLYTGYLLGMQRARTLGLGPWGTLARAATAGAPGLLLVAWALGERIAPGLWWPLLALSLSSQIIGQGATVVALPHFSPLVIGLALLLQPAIAAAAGWWLFAERLGPADLLGMVAIGAALVLVRLPSGRRPSTGTPPPP